MSTERILELARSLTRDEFVKRHDGHFLVITDRGEDEPPNGFETVDVTTTPSAFLAVRPSIEVHPIVKAQGNPYPDRISVGRARNCDVVLRHASVSKLHASFRPRADGSLDVVDLGSQLGTRVNGRSSAPNELTRVAPGFLLMLGRVAARVADARIVWDLVRAQAAIDAMSAPPGSAPRGALGPTSTPPLGLTSTPARGLASTPPRGLGSTPPAQRGSAPPGPRGSTSVPPGPRSSPAPPGSAPRSGSPPAPASAPRSGSPGSSPPGRPPSGSYPSTAAPQPRSSSPGAPAPGSAPGSKPGSTPPGTPRSR